MSVSEDEDDFLSADEDVEDEEKNKSLVAEKHTQPEEQPQPRVEKHKTNNTGDASEPIDLKPIQVNQSGVKKANLVQARPEPEVEVRQAEEQQSAQTMDATGELSASSPTTPKSTSDSSESEDSAKLSGTPDEEDPDDEEVLSERIRERNLKIARKFSAELAKNIKASAPIPVNSSAPIGFKISNIESPNISDSDAKAGTPPAPPPTPALSSSFSNADDAIAAAAAAAAASTSGTSAGTSGSSTFGASQYGWRVPSRSRPKQSPQAPPPSPPSPQEDKSAQARQALDRLSDNLSFSCSDSKNLFERVAEDLRKVSIKSEQPGNSQDSFVGFGASNIPLISDLGSTLGSWNWNSASKLLASASQVTQQIGSVLDSVVNPPQPPSGDHTEQKTSQQSLKQAHPDSS